MPSTKQRQFEPKDSVYTPAEVSAYALQEIENATKAQPRALPLGIEHIDGYFAPVRPGQTCTILAQTSNFKSGFLRIVEENAAKLLVAQNRTDEILVHVSVEEGVEEQAFISLSQYTDIPVYDLATGSIPKGKWAELVKGAYSLSSAPIYRMGDSIARADLMPELYMSNIIRGLQYIQTEFGAKFAGIFFDYLQAFPIDPEIRAERVDVQRRLQVRSDIYRIRQAAAYFNCPTFVAVQAKQNLEGSTANWRMPSIYDCEETSAISQRTDRMIGLWLVKMTHPEGSKITIGKRSMQVTDDLLMIKVLKQRGALPSGRVYMTSINYRANRINVVPQQQSLDDL